MAESNQSFTWNFLDAVVALKASWKRVAAQTVSNCFRRAGFVTTDEEDIMEVVDSEPEGRSEEDRNIWDRLRTLYGESVPNNMTEYLSVDYNAATAPLLDADQIIAMVHSGSDIRDVESGDENEGQGDVVEETVKLSDALSALRTLRLYGLPSWSRLGTR